VSIRIASWNIEGRLSPYATHGRGTPDKIVDEIERLDADVVILPEAYDKSIGINARIEGRIANIGYEHIYDVEYQSGGPVRTYSAVDEPYLRIMSKLAFNRTETIRPGDLRNMPVVTVTDPDTGKMVQIVGVHFEDRSEALRLREVGDLVELANSSKTELIIQGDMNAMYGQSSRARFMRSGFMKQVSQVIPSDVLSDIVSRASDMATGTTLDTFASKTALTDADPRHQYTATPRLRGSEFFPSIPFIDLDHSLHSPGIVVKDFGVGRRDSGSDHRPITLEASITK